MPKGPFGHTFKPINNNEVGEGVPVLGDFKMNGIGVFVIYLDFYHRIPRRRLGNAIDIIEIESFESLNVHVDVNVAPSRPTDERLRFTVSPNDIEYGPDKFKHELKKMALNVNEDLVEVYRDKLSSLFIPVPQIKDVYSYANKLNKSKNDNSSVSHTEGEPAFMY